ncbi:hypothetical protein P170DRAFT_348322 [Aspergillus steynii IBT 23096]|uniref:EGF-like domain-containing protein n=1 Tax=Aspergillus steynii IBT 23096 TaxID=1392250 RepID=A0A2I2GHM9_9EURO|nr:uncharacterized protein P170DRAFT_348322 [Aspergillus steynii IBT 23096]PLB52391.1 hypothetical protein P170DRAFT_348322 [Aspergillus steynii IBT 23096]
MERKGSVRRAREMLEAGRRPEARGPPANLRPPPPPIRMNQAHMTQWPLPNDNLQGPMPMVDPSARLFVPKGPPPQRPPRPDLPSPSVYSERSDSDATPSPLHIQRPVPSFSQPLGHPPPPPRPVIRDPVPPSPTSPEEPTTRISVATDDLFRQSAASSIGSIPSIPDFPFPAQPVTAESQRQFHKQQPNLAPPPLAQLRPGLNRQSSVSPIPEEGSDSPTIHEGSFASSRVIPSSWGSARAESDILETYLDGESDEDQSPKSTGEARNVTLVRQASLGKRGVPALRTISRSNADSPLPPPQESMPKSMPQGAAFKEVSAGANDRRDSFSSTSTSSSHFDLEKAPIVLDLGHPHPPQNRANPSMGALEKEMGALPRAAPTMSDKRPGARRPPRLDMSAVRDAEKRGSLTSLPDLIRRATKLASNLEHGRTASRNDLLNAGGGPRFAGHQYRRSGSIKDLLASFPPPAATPEGGRGSPWPVFFRRSTLHHIKSNETMPDEAAGNEKVEKRPRRCCGMPLWLFILICALVIIIILVAVLVPVFLVANKNSGANCESSTPCANGGVSVSSGDVCSCVCSNGFTGSQCTISGDSSCTTTQIGQGSSSKNATMGSNLPRLFDNAQSDFGVPLDSVTIMALFSQNNVSCTTENSLVAFKDVHTGSSKDRRALPVASDPQLASIPDQAFSDSKPPTPTTFDVRTKTLAARAEIGTQNGIVFDTSVPTETMKPMTFTGLPEATQTKPLSHSTTTSSATSTATASPSSTSVSTSVVDFSRIAVLYIFEKTGAFRAATYSEEKIQSYLAKSYPDSDSNDFSVDLTNAGVKGTFSLDFDKYRITLPNGDVVGGD